MIGKQKEINSGTHQFVLKAVNTDTYGVELDMSIVNLTCASGIQQSSTCINVSSLSTDSLNCSNLPYATQNSSDTDCAEEDNVNIPIFYTEVKSFQIHAQLPQYFPSITTMNNRQANFDNCKFASKNIWEIGMNDNNSSEFSILCASQAYTIGEPISTFCHGIGKKFNNTKYKIYFTAKGISRGLVEASIGSVLTVKFMHVTCNLTIEVKCFGRDKRWLSLGIAVFNSTEFTKTWHVPDLTWSEGQNTNLIQLEVVENGHMNASGKFDFLKLDKREERGESTPITVFNNGATIVEAITLDFWWLYPKGMIIKNLNNNKEWQNISYFRIYRKIPGTSHFSQLFVLYQDGNSRILPFPPNGIDWIPFGSSVIIGPTTSNSIRPYASITRVNINVLTLEMELHYESGGKATATLEYTTTSTTINVDRISFNTTPPFTTFRSMWVSDGNADVDHVMTERNSWHINDGWQSISALSFKFYRSCVSSHNTLSPDIHITVKCKRAEMIKKTSEASLSSKCSTFTWLIITISLSFSCYISSFSV